MADISPSCTKSSKIIDVLMPTTVEVAAGKWQYNFAVLPEAGYGPTINDIIWTYTGGSAHADATYVGKNSSGYWTYYTLLDDGYTPSAITLKIGSTVIGSFTYSIKVLKGSGVTGATVYRLVDNSYIESSTAMAGDTVSVSITLESSVTTVSTPYASYTDASGAVHQVTLTAVNDTSWTFTMPAGDVVVATNGEAGGGGGDWGFVDKNTVIYPVQIVALAPLEAVFEKAREVFITNSGYTYEFPTFESLRNMLTGDGLTRLNEIDNLSSSKMIGISIRGRSNDSIIMLFVYKDMVDTVPFTADSGTKSVLYYINGLQIYIKSDGTVNYYYVEDNREANAYGFANRYWVGYGYYNVAYYGYGCTNLLTTIPTPSSSILVDYTLTPSTAGEITGPETLESSADFQFTFTVYPGYQFQRVSATSVILGENNINSYIMAGTTVTVNDNVYTVTVTNLDENLNGVNIVVTCLSTNDPNNTPNTPASGVTFDPNDPSTWPPGFDPDTDPNYDPSDPSTWPVGALPQPQGGDGDHDLISDIITPSAVPGLSAHDSGLIKVYRPTLAQLQDLGSYLWTHFEDFIANIQKWFSNPMDYIISLSVVPCVPNVSADEYIDIGLVETTIQMPPVTSQWVTIDCGTIQVNKFYGSALDYSPYTKISAMLPFIGSVHLDTDEIMGKNVQLIYRIDIVSGHCVAMIVVDRTVLYQFSGECAASIPLTGADWSRVYGAIVNTAIGVATIGAVGAAGNAGRALDSSASVAATSQALDSLVNVSERMKGIPGVKEARELALQNVRNAQNVAYQRGNTASAIRAQTRIHAVGNTVNSVMGAKVQAGHASSITGNAGLIGTRKPYLLIEFPNQSLAESYKHFMGYPSNVSGTIGSFKGYTVFEQVVPSIACTDDELSEILEALKGGVYL